jgi:hypothetical protein
MEFWYSYIHARKTGKISVWGVVPEESGSAGQEVFGALTGAAPTDVQASALEALRAWDTMAQGAYPPYTVRAWRSDWRSFVQLCFVKNERPLPASPRTVRAYVQYCMEAMKKPATIRRYLATIARAHFISFRASRTGSLA